MKNFTSTLLLSSHNRKKGARPICPGDLRYPQALREGLEQLAKTEIAPRPGVVKRVLRIARKNNFYRDAE